MQKVVTILEQHVQWIAIGLGALFCLFMVWSYVLQAPAKVSVANETLTAGEIDEFTARRVVGELDRAIVTNANIKVVVPNPVEQFETAMAWRNAPPVAFNPDVMNTLIADVPLPQVATGPGPVPPGPRGPRGPRGPQPPQPVVPGDKVAQLPLLPQALPDQVKFGRSVVLLPEDGQPVQQPQPGQPVVGGIDKDWVTAMFTLNMDQLAQSFRDAKIPLQLQKAVFLEVELQREELDADGMPIPDTQTIIEPLETWRANMPPPPFPGEGADERQAQALYLQWAIANTPDILQPLFYTTVPNRGDQWVKPGEQLVDPQQMFNPQEWIDAPDLSSLTAEQRAQVMQMRRERAKLDAEQKRQNRPTPTPRGPMRGTPGGLEGEMMYAPAKPSNFAPAPPRQPVRRPYGGVPPYPMDVGMEMEGEFGGGWGGAAVQPGLPQPGVDYPQGEFDVNDPLWQGKQIEIWAHDDTLEADKTYRYRVRYKIRNPIFLSHNAANDPALALQFAIVSDWSAWTSPMTVPPLVNFFIAAQALGGNSVRFQVFRWVEGENKAQLFTVAPGDQVGGMHNGIDFSTDWTVVDVRQEQRPQEQQVLLVNSDGRVIVRSHQADSKDPLYNQLKQQMAAQAAAEAEAGLAAGAIGPAGNGPRARQPQPQP